MSTWLHCDKPEPHEGHSWESHGINGYDLPETSYHHCPGVKDHPDLRVLINVRDVLRGQVVSVETDLREQSLKHRRSITQYEIADDLAVRVDVCGDTNNDGDCLRCLRDHLICPKEWR